MQCENCSASFAPNPYSGDIVNGQCPNCGHPYRSQPNPLKSDMTHGLEAMPTSTQDDMSGNPLKEGILADNGWQNRQRRDESYASVQSQSTMYDDLFNRITPHEYIWADPQPKEAAEKTANPLLALGLGEAALGAGEAGGASALLGGAAKQLTPSILGQGVGSLMKGVFGGGSDGGQTPLPQVDERLSGKIESPSSVDEIDTDDDPEKQDQKEKNDGDTKEWQKDFSVNGIGGTDEGFDSPFAPDSPAIAALQHTLPLVIQFATSNESGAHHPLLKALHEMLEGEVPGYQDHDNPEAAHQIIMMVKGDGDKKEKKEANGVPNPGSVPNPTQQYQTGLPQQGLHGRCPLCGGTTDPSNPTCPQCGAATISTPGAPVETQQNNQMMPVARQVEPYNEGGVMFGHPDDNIGPMVKSEGVCPDCGHYTTLIDGRCTDRDCPGRLHTAASHQGPHTPEQISAVQQLLMDQGRTDELPLVPVQPWDYADELAQVQQADNPPTGPGDDPGQQAPPPPPDVAPQPDGAMPMPGMQAPPLGMQSALERYASDNVAPKCPKCDSHTTGLVSKDGDCRCSSCGNHWKTDAIVHDSLESTARWHVTALEKEHMEHDQDINPIDVPAADMEHPNDPEKNEDSSRTWQDANGQPLQVGQQYTVHSDMSPIPDVMEIVAVKPESIEVKETGSYGLGFSHEISHQEYQEDNLQFEPLGDFGDQDQTQPGEAQDLELEPGDQGDLSTPHENIGVRASLEHTPADDSYQSQSGDYADDKPIHVEVPYRDAFTGEQSVYRGPVMAIQPFTHKSGEELHRLVINPMTTMNVRPGEYNVVGTDDLDALPEVPTNHPQHNAKEAGAKFTPMEQREFIDEQGIARNSDRLDLSHTHYTESHVEDIDDHFLW